MQSFRSLRVWEKSHRLTLDIYKASKSFPREEVNGLTSPRRLCVDWHAHRGRLLS